MPRAAERTPYEPDAADPSAAVFDCVCCYDGCDFGGWQTQPHGNTVQDAIEVRLGKLLGRPVQICGAGRTDAGVHARGQHFHFRLPGGSWPPPLRGAADAAAAAARLQQCLAALVDNAVRYSAGAVHLAVSASDDSVILHVRDQGPGIPEEERIQVLERFVRGSTAIGTRGSGIGLATVQLLVEAMQGELLIGEVPEGGADLQLCFRISDLPPAP